MKKNKTGKFEMRLQFLNFSGERYDSEFLERIQCSKEYLEWLEDEYQRLSNDMVSVIEKYESLKSEIERYNDMKSEKENRKEAF